MCSTTLATMERGVQEGMKESKVWRKTVGDMEEDRRGHGGRQEETWRNIDSRGHRGRQEETWRKTVEDMEQDRRGRGGT